MQKDTESERFRKQRQTRNQSFQFELPSCPDGPAMSQLAWIIHDFASKKRKGALKD
jgi:hypothetical protein